MLDRQDRPRKTEDTKSNGTSVAQKPPNRQIWLQTFKSSVVVFCETLKFQKFSKIQPAWYGSAMLSFVLSCWESVSWRLGPRCFSKHSFLASDNNLETMHGGFCQKRKGNCSSPDKKEKQEDVQARSKRHVKCANWSLNLEGWRRRPDVLSLKYGRDLRYVA